ncbi:MAG: hypothetical protein ACM3ML_05140 [Micromonosporaceae bacterium]
MILEQPLHAGVAASALPHGWNTRNSLNGSVSAKTGIVRVTGTGSNSGQVDFTEYGTAVTLTPPSASQTLDGKKFGF